MKYPKLVPERVCTTPCTVYRTDGLNRDGSKNGRSYLRVSAFIRKKHGRNYPQKNSL